MEAFFSNVLRGIVCSGLIFISGCVDVDIVNIGSEGSGILVKDLGITDPTVATNQSLKYSVSHLVLTINVPTELIAPNPLETTVSSYSISPTLPAGLEFNTTTGVLSGTPTHITPIQSYEVVAITSKGVLTVQLSIQVNDVAPAISYSGGPLTYTKGQVISDIVPTSAGGAVTLYSISPALSAGLSMNSSTGVISGTPTAISPPRTYTVTATNSGGFATASIHLTVNDIAPSQFSYSSNSATYTKGSLISPNTPSYNGGTVTSYSVSPALPAGLLLNASTGVISGTPTVPTSTNTYTVTAANSGGSTTVDLSLTINDVAPSSLTYSLNPAVYTKGLPISDNSPTSSGGGIVSYSVSPSLPAGLALNSSTGVISGTPTNLTSTQSHTITASNSVGSTSVTLTLTVNDVVPSSLSYSTNAGVYTKGSAIPNNIPTSNGGSVISYSIVPSLPDGLALDSGTGIISGTPTEVTPIHTYTITGTNSGGFTTTSISITVNDISLSNLSYSANPAVYTQGSAIIDNSPTSSGGTVVSYSISPSLPTGLAFNTSTGIISGTPTTLSSSRSYTITAINSGGFTTTNLTLTVNDVAPSSLSYSTNPATYTKGAVIVNNSPSSSGGPVVSYSVTPTLPTGLSLDTSTGVILGIPTTISSPTPYTITATNSGGSTSVSLTIRVNDLVPSNLTYSATTPVYTKGTAILNNSPSSSGGAVVSYSIAPTLPTGLSLDTGTGIISGTPATVSASSVYTVTASNSGGSTSVNLTLVVNDLPPSNLSYSANPTVYTKGSAILDNTPSSNGGGVVSYSVSPALPLGLSLDTATGIISGTPSVVASSALYTVTATNSGGSVTGSLSITVNDVAPSNLTYSNNPAVYTKGTPISNNSPSSVGGAVISYSIFPPLPSGLSFNTISGIISGTPGTTSASTSYLITATNSGGSTSTTLPLTVNDAPPTGLTYTENPAIYTLGTAISENLPTSSGGTVTEYSVFPALPSGLSFDTVTGAISGIPTVISATTVYLVTVTGTGGSASFNLTLTVNDVAPSNLSYSSSPATYTKGTSISNNTPTSAGGTVISYSVSPSLPSGLSINTSTGVISGTPSVVASSALYTVTATNSGGSTSVNLTLTVNDIPPSNLTYSAQTATYTRGSAISSNTPSSSGGAVVSYSVTPSLPANLSLNTSTGVISGTPSLVAASASYTITATNSGGSTTASLALTINDISPSTLTYSENPAVYIRGAPVSNNSPSSTGGTVITYEISPSLPAGLSFDTSSGVISGTPTAFSPSTPYTVTATNTGGSTTVTLSLAVNDIPPSSLSYTLSSPTYTKGAAISNNSPSSNGGAVISYQISPTLPSGLSINTSTGVISGTPSVIKPATTHTVTATNSGGFTTTSITITVNDLAPSNLQYSSPSPNYTQGVAITSNIPSANGGPIVSYSVFPTLPPGLSLDTATGVISGTPSEIRTSSTFLVTATNTGGSASVEITITVQDVAPSNLTYSIQTATFTKGITISNNNPLSSGGAVISYSIAPALPPGLSLDTSTGVISGTPSAVAASAPYTVTATNSGGSATTILTFTVNDVAPTNLAYSTNPANYTKDTTISSNTPSSDGGMVTSYSISPPLPAGLSFDTSTGVISGTASVASVSAPYTVTATNSGGATSVVLTLSVDGPPSGLSYSANPATYATGATIANNTPSSTGGIVQSYSVSPALPAGLSLNTVSGIISGTPTTLASAATYTITATNFLGSTTVGVNISVVSGFTTFSYPFSRFIFTPSLAIIPITPTITGTSVTSCTSVPSLPPGLALSSSTCVISGTPSETTSPYTPYTITAANTVTSVNTTIQIGIGPSTLQWTWVSGSSLSGQTGNYGTKGVASSTNVPGNRLDSTLVADTTSGSLWLFGGYGGVNLNDLWKWDGTNWTWLSGSSAGTTQYGVYGVKGSGAASNFPGTRSGHVSWTDSNGNFWVFGGNGQASTGSSSYLNDLWKWDGTNWTWMSGGSTIIQAGIYGTKGVASSTNTPGSRANHSAVKDGSGNIWVFGGSGLGVSTASNGYLNDLWKWDGTNWTWVSGSTIINPTASYGTKGTASASNAPLGLYGAGVTIDADKIWVFGGYSPSTLMNTLWKWDGTNWTWMSGGTTNGLTSVYGTKGVAASSNIPSGRYGSMTWRDSNGMMWVFGGFDGISGAQNNLWKWDGTNWTWMAGNTLTNQIGIYGTKGVAASTNYPGVKYSAPSAVDSNGDLWMFGGSGFSASSASGTLNDLWKFSPIAGAPAGLSYSSPSATYLRNSAISNNMPSSTGGIISSYSVSPALPAGLSLNTVSGIISGTPTVLSASTSYTVSGINPSGSTNTTLTIAVMDAPSNLTYSLNPATYYIGSAITPNTPTSSGSAVTSYSVSPDLPAGLSLNTLTGAISGTPSGATATAVYTVTATNAVGSTNFGVSINVPNDLVSLTYPASNYTFSPGVASTVTPIILGGAPTSCTASPSLPSGLSLSNTCVIYGSLTGATTPFISYLITASNSVNSVSGTVQIGVGAQTPMWTWVAGSTTGLQATVYGTKGVAASTNVLGTRMYGTAQADSNGNIWLFGGYTSGYLNDLWKWDGTNWTWMAGSSTPNQSGAYGTKGVASTSNFPGARRTEAFWSDSSGNMWMFGGIGTPGRFNDLWKWDGTNWTWMAGSSSLNQLPVFGTKGVAATSNTPGGRDGAYTTKDPSGNIWLFGGYSNSGRLNDLWKWDGINWTWMAGSSSYNQSGMYGTKNVAATSNVPPGVQWASIMADSSGVWVFGGWGNLGYLNALWRWNGTNWIWVSGANAADQTGVYGTKGVAASTNVPASISRGLSWRDSVGNIWIFGGDTGTNGSWYNTLWKWDGTNWTWVSGSSLSAQWGVYGTKGVPALTNVPGSRYAAGGGLDSNGNPWIYSTEGYDSSTPNRTYLNDLWKYLPGPAAPTGLSYSSNPAIYLRNSAISNNIPSSTGGIITTYSVSPALPAGLSLDTSSGVISGTPTSNTASTSYTITASNSSGSTTGTLTLTVTDPPSNLTYSTNPATYYIGSAIAPNTPSSTGIITSYSVSPSLPAGLSLNTSTGVISGTPPAAAPLALYTITGTNLFGSTTVDVSIFVSNAITSFTYPLSSYSFPPSVAIAPVLPAFTGGLPTSCAVNPLLPSGLSLSSSCVISGTPGSATSPLTTYTVTASNSTNSIDRTLQISVGNQNQAWTWMSGGNASIYQAGVYGTQGVAASSNVPAGRRGVSGAASSSGTIWIFGGDVSTAFFNDFWKWDGINWTWISGGTASQGGVYGTKGVGSTSNFPGARSSHVSWTDSGGNFWILGGYVTSYSYIFGDMWKWDGTNWTWMAGSSSYNQYSVYGTKGTSASSNFPSSRTFSSISKDQNGNIWLFGGYGYASGGLGYLNDLWKWDGTNWTWMAGSSVINQAGVYGTLGVAASTNVPSGLNETNIAADWAGGIWIFGGYASGYSNALWKWDGTNWIWISGSTASSGVGVYGTKGVAASSNVPAGAGRAAFWRDSIGRLWIFGGYGAGAMNALWKWDGTNWTWVAGSSSTGDTGTYGTKGVASTSNIPAARFSTSANGVDSSGNAWIFGGAGNVYLNDLWKMTSIASAPSALSYSVSPAVYAKNSSISNNIPSSTGGVISSYSVSPALPTGLSLDTISGVISGTPSAITASASYTVTGTNVSGSTNAVLNITVNDAAPSGLTYANNPVSYPVKYAITSNTPSNTGGTVNNYSITPSLPAGLSFNTLTGVISGTPTLVNPETSYTVTATNVTGATTANISIAVAESAPGNLSYSSNPVTYFVGYAASTNTPTALGSPVANYSVSPSLPDGLLLNASTGVIAGTPTTSSPTSTYTVTATNTWGSTTANLSITISEATTLTALSYPSSSYAFEPNIAITPVVATYSGGPPSSCTPSPSLPSGLSISSLCVISGTPTGPGGTATNYTITASNAFGPINTTVNLRVAGQTQLWTWVSGSASSNQGAVYGTSNVAASSNVPGARYGSSAAIGSAESLWIFGGYGYGQSLGYLKDLWKWDGTNWTWVAGNSTVNSYSVYGTKGVAASSNAPGSRVNHVSWMISGTYWLFGGYGFASTSSGQMNDLWKWDGTNWTWVSGSSTQNQAGVLGTKGVAASTNFPAARDRPAYEKDSSGNVWFFGGNGSSGYLSDLWKWDGTNWTWISGTSAAGVAATYGTKGLAATSNFPGNRWGATAAIDSSGNFWIFGGGSSGGDNNSLWKWDGTNWTWISGSSSVNSLGTYGTKGVASSSNTPGARDSQGFWTDSSGYFWVFGGNGYGASGGSGYLNDLWKWDGTNWTWVAGSSTITQVGIYGTKGTASAFNSPGSRYPSGARSNSAFWVFGGQGIPSSGAGGYLNDLWKFVY